MGQGGGALFLVAQMSQDFVDDVLVLNTSNNPYRPTAPAADLDVDIEDALEVLGPGHRALS